VPLPKQVARLNKAGLNRVVIHIAPRMSGMGLIVHLGRRSGREYRTPVQVFQARDGFIVALTYGVDTDWLRNIQAAGGGLLRTRGLTFQVSEPRVYHDEERTGIRLAERQMLRLLDVADFVHLKALLRYSS
jgi:deazaflavin-dependent oxidoreductase (nitroreductase family)